MFKPSVVIPSVESRQDNLNAVLDHVDKQTLTPEAVVVVCDGWEPESDSQFVGENINVFYYSIPKHRPGLEQPRNRGVRFLQSLGLDTNYVHFLDSDCLPAPDCLAQYKLAHEYSSAVDRIMLGPYDWMGPGSRNIQEDLYNDPRWEMFNTYGDYTTTFEGHLGVSLGCFSGNLVWPIKEFVKVGGFWSELHMGRCEDGELGLRACSMMIPMALVKNARAFHIHHEINSEAIYEKNARDVPLLNKRHPWVEGEEIFVVDTEGKRFEWLCSECGQYINTGEFWGHFRECPNV